MTRNIKERVIVDSSVIVKWLSLEGEQHVEQVNLLLSDVKEGRVHLYSPELAKYEVGNVMLQKGTPLAQTVVGTATIYALPIQFIPETKELSELTTQVAYTSSMTYYDASFVALAESLKGKLVTDNIKHQGKTTHVEVVPLRNYRSKE